jgi:glycosyltransferase involved in cell wall biosynthesis
LRIAIYHPWIYVKSGLERTIMEIFRRSRHDWTIYTSHYDRERTYPELRTMNIVEVNRVSVVRRYGAVIRGAMTIAGTKLDVSRYDALMVCCDGLGSLITFRNHDIPVICLCFTPLRAVYDEEYKRRHVGRAGMMRPLAAVAEIAWRFVDRMAWKHYRHIFCITETVKRRALAGRLCRAEDVEIAYAGIAHEKIRASGIFEPMFLVPGRIMWTKNVELAIDAFREFMRHCAESNFRMVIAGMVDRKSEPYLEKLCTMAAGVPGISFLRDLTDAEMEALYQRCHAVLFTPFNEDQGLTPLEAGMHGKPVIAVNRGGPTETVIHERTGLLVEPDPNAFAKAMVTLASDQSYARRLGEAGLERSRLFTWEAFVSRIDNYLDTLHA